MDLSEIQVQPTSALHISREGIPITLNHTNHPLSRLIQIFRSQPALRYHLPIPLASMSCPLWQYFRFGFIFHAGNDDTGSNNDLAG
jgi:hypothetical protein